MRVRRFRPVFDVLTARITPTDAGTLGTGVILIATPVIDTVTAPTTGSLPGSTVLPTGGTDYVGAGTPPDPTLSVTNPPVCTTWVPTTP